MLGDISNQLRPSIASPLAGVNRTSPLDDAPKSFASSSSSPSRLTGASSPFFSNSRLDAFHASSSPGPVNKLLSSPIKRPDLLATLPPSSPSFGLRSSPPPALADASAQSTYSQDVPDLVQDEPLQLRLEPNTVLYFGRKAKKAIPRTRSPGFDPAERSVPILLPKSAKNASRIHCSARIVKDRKARAVGKATIEVRVTGQNGMRIDGQLWKANSLARLTVESGRELEFAFWGWNANVEVIAPTSKEKNKDSKRQRVSRPTTSPASSSFNSSFDDDDDEHDALHGDELNYDLPATSKRQRLSSPALSTASLSSHSSTSISITALRARSLAKSPSLDLTGILASTIVFHPRSTVGVDELVRALLKESGEGLWQVLSEDRTEVERMKETARGEDEAVRAWIPVCQDILKRERMFGTIDNGGLKDAAGRPLPPYYYYIPDLDPSRARVEALEPFVKRVRGARTSKPIRYFWAKPK
ncbi:uncharacterized protein JCM15063_005678 [Sporobolomyces koalae]|uniref:uncharacterized protein n=1 Tax=Sporobolomyces koalae TaxID=500713 RepID=UPI00317C5B9E